MERHSRYNPVAPGRPQVTIRLADPPRNGLPPAKPYAWNPGEAERRSEEHTSELQSRQYLVCRLLLEKKKNSRNFTHNPRNYKAVRLCTSPTDASSCSIYSLTDSRP